MAKKSVMRKACEVAQCLAKLLETDENGYGKCKSCGEMKQWGELQGGHFQPKGNSYNGACLDERNIHIQCSGCNLFKGGNPAGYLKFMIEEYGEDIGEELHLLSCQTSDTEFAYQFIIEGRAKCRELAKDKSCHVRIP